MALGFRGQGHAQELQGLAARRAPAGGQAKEGLHSSYSSPAPAGFGGTEAAGRAVASATTFGITGPCATSALALTLRPLGSARVQSGQMVHSGQDWRHARLRQMLLDT